MKEAVSILQEALLTEKATMLSANLNQYVFSVAVNSSKQNIKDAVEKTSATGSGKLPLGTTQQRDAGNAADLKGFIRYNTSDNKFEGHDDAGWHTIAAEGNTVSFAGLSATGVVNFDISQLTAI